MYQATRLPAIAFPHDMVVILLLPQPCGCLPFEAVCRLLLEGFQERKQFSVLALISHEQMKMIGHETLVQAASVP